VILKKGAYVVVIGPKLPNAQVRIHTATHEVLIVPKAMLKKV
jgi:hypothetical protein